MSTDEDEFTFPGFRSPTYTQVPDELFDTLLPKLSGAELKVLLYIMRRTFGFKKDSDSISFSQICDGIRASNGHALDFGTGLSKSTAQLALKGLVKKRIVLATKRVSRERGNEPTTYGLNLGTPYADSRYRAMPKIGIALYRESAQQETVRQQTDFDPSNFERSRPSEVTEDDPTGRGAPPLAEPSRRTDGATEPSGREELDTETRAVPLGEVLQLRRRSAATIGQGGRTEAGPPSAPPAAADRPAPSRAGRLKGTAEERERLRAYLGDFAAELGDEASLASSITRALNLFRAAGVPPELWGDHLYRARAITQERTAQITKPSRDGGTIRRKNKMPYFFEVLEDLLGL